MKIIAKESIHRHQSQLLYRSLMKVLIISHTYITKINREKWKILAQHHPEIQLMVIVPKTWPGHLYHHEAGDLEVESFSNCSFLALDAIYVGNERKYRYSWKQLYKIIKTYSPTILHVEQGAGAYSYFQALVCAQFMKNKPRTLFFTWVNWRHPFSFKHKLFWSWIEKYTLAHSDGALTGNHGAAELLRCKGFIKSIDVIPQLGVDTTLFSPAFSAPSKNIIGYVGRFTEEKGVLLLLQAFLFVSEKFPEWNLMFVGSGPFEKVLFDYVEDHNLTHRVLFKGAVTHEHVVPVLQQLKLLVLPSHDTLQWKEQFGHILIEAMACGVPVIGSNAGEIEHVLGDAGLIFEQKSCNDLVRVLCTAMHDEQLRSVLSIQSRERVHAQFSHEAIAEKIVTFWKQIAQA